MFESELLKTQLKKALPKNLQGERSHLKMIPPDRNLSINSGPGINIKESSVLILLYSQDNQLFCCLIKRTKTMTYHAGQIAFPGGTIDKTDKNSLATALRETNEEVGICPESIEIIEKLSDIYISASNFLIHPFIGWHQSKPDFIKNNYEVERIINFPIFDFINTKKYDYAYVDTNSGKLNVRCFIFQKEIIWGATAMILSELFDILKELPVIQELHSGNVDNY